MQVVGSSLSTPPPPPERFRIESILHQFQTNHTVDIRTTVTLFCGKPTKVAMDYLMEVNGSICEFHLSYYPHQLQKFIEILREIFGVETSHQLFGDFKSHPDPCDQKPAFYIHLIEKQQQRSAMN